MDFPAAVWRRSSFTGGGGDDNCVEVALVPAAVGVRDSKHRDGGRLIFDRRAWDLFGAAIKVTPRLGIHRRRGAGSGAAAAEAERRSAVLDSFRGLLDRLDVDLIERDEAEDHTDLPA